MSRSRRIVYVDIVTSPARPAFTACQLPAEWTSDIDPAANDGEAFEVAAVPARTRTVAAYVGPPALAEAVADALRTEVRLAPHLPHDPTCTDDWRRRDPEAVFLRDESAETPARVRKIEAHIADTLARPQPIEGFEAAEYLALENAEYHAARLATDEQTTPPGQTKIVPWNSSDREYVTFAELREDRRLSRHASKLGNDRLSKRLRERDCPIRIMRNPDPGRQPRVKANIADAREHIRWLIDDRRTAPRKPTPSERLYARESADVLGADDPE